MTKFSNKFKKPCFWPIFPIFGAKKNFLENPALPCTTSYGFLAPCQNLEKVNDTIQRKHSDRRKKAETLFYRTLLAITRGPKSFFLYFVLKYIIFKSPSWQQNKPFKLPSNYLAKNYAKTAVQRSHKYLITISI